MKPETKGEWLDKQFKFDRPRTLYYAIDASSEEKSRDPERVKEIYLKEGTLFLRKKLLAPGPRRKVKESTSPLPILEPDSITHTP